MPQETFDAREVTAVQSSPFEDVVESERVPGLEEDRVCPPPGQNSLTGWLFVSVGSRLRLGQEESRRQSSKVDVLVVEVLHHDLLFIIQVNKPVVRCPD